MTWGGIRRNLTDAMFSDYVRIKAGWKCEVCKRDFSTRKGSLHCSHFFGRRSKSVRWCEANCIAACVSCHRHFTENPNDYKSFMEKRLGVGAFESLVLKAKAVKKYTDEKIVRLWLRQELAKLKTT